MSITKQSKKQIQVALVFLTAMAFTAVFLAGCGATPDVKQTPAGIEQSAAAPEVKDEVDEEEEGVDADPAEGNRITGLQIKETPDAYEVVISANYLPDYTLAEPPFQQARVLYFPDAGLDLEATEVEMENDIIGPVKASELVAGGPSKIVIPVLTVDPEYEVRRDGDRVLKVIFPKATADASSEEDLYAGEQSDVDPVSFDDPDMEEQPDVDAVSSVDPDKEEAAEIQPQPESVPETVTGAAAVPEKPAPLASTLKAVDVITRDRQVDVKVIADGSVKIFKSFALSAPPRIVVDLDGIGSPYEKEQRLTVDSDIVSQVRHFSHDKYLRLVLDVNPDYLSDYDAVTIRDGLLVTVGVAAPTRRQTPQSERMVAERAAVQAEAEAGIEETAVDEQEPTLTATKKNDNRGYDKLALVNAINFIEESGGRSTIQIGTTHPVNYELVSIDDKQLRLHLMNTNIHRFRQRPLLTTRFNSAVDVIAPLQTDRMKEEEKTFVDIRLREKVPYEVEQKENTILVHFAASSIAPDPVKSVVIPTEHMLQDEEERVTEAPAAADEQKFIPEERAVASPEPGTMPPAEPRREPSPETPETAAVAPGDEPETVAAISPEAEAGTDADIVDILGWAPKKKYTGEQIAMDFYKTDIRNVIRILKDVSGKNFAVDRDVAGSVTLNFVNPVPWDLVLDLILEMNDLGLIERSGIIRIATRDTIRRQKESVRAELAAQQDLKKTEEELVPLVTEYFAVSYSQAGADIMPHIQDLLTDRGHAKVDSRTNQVIMTDIPERIEKAREVIARIDKVTPQVMISARVVETSTSFSREFGTEWGADNNPGAFRTDMGGTYGYNVAMNNPSAAATNTLGVNFSRIVGTPFSLDAKLSLMESTGEVKIISTPRVVTLNNKTASISQGQEFPYQTVEDGNVKVEFKDADLRLEVTPQVTPDNRIGLKIFIEEKEIGQSTPGQEPPLNTKEARTELLVNDGDTVVIGGIIQQVERESISGVPFISRIPVLGHLFKSTTRSNEKTELMIFITPTVVRLD